MILAEKARSARSGNCFKFGVPSKLATSNDLPFSHTTALGIHQDSSTNHIQLIYHIKPTPKPHPNPSKCLQKQLRRYRHHISSSNASKTDNCIQTPTTAGKAPAGKAPAEKKEAGKKTAAASGDKKKRTKTRKETYSSYIYKGTTSIVAI